MESIPQVLGASCYKVLRMGFIIPNAGMNMCGLGMLTTLPLSMKERIKTRQALKFMISFPIK